jgi:hypothetical protein
VVAWTPSRPIADADILSLEVPAFLAFQVIRKGDAERLSVLTKVITVKLHWRILITQHKNCHGKATFAHGLLYSPPQGKKLAFPCFPLAESGLFNGLQRIQIKKSSRASTRVSGCEQNGSTSQASIISGHPRIISRFLIFAKENQSETRRRTFFIILIAIPCFCWRL